MPYKHVLNIFLAFTLLNCSTPVKQYSSIEDDLAGIIKDDASKTSSFKIYSLNILKVDTVTSTVLDSQLVTKTHNRLEFCNTLADLYASMAKTNNRIRTLSRKMKHSTLPSIASEDIKDDAYTAQLYKDSAKYYNYLLDSLNSIRDYNNKFFDTLYKVRTFLKATEKINNDSVTYFGTKYYYITKNKKIVDMPGIR